MIKVGVIGFGYWGPIVCRNVSSTPGLKLQAICDLQEKLRSKASLLFPSARVVSTAKELIEDPEIDVVAVVTPVSTHYELARAALSAGKHVFVEKPFTFDTDQARKLIDLAGSRGLTIMVDHTFLFTGAVRKMKELLDAGELGRLYYYDSVRINLGLLQHDINVIWDLAPHDLSIMNFLLAQKPLALCAHGASHFNRKIEDVAYLILYFPNDLIAHFHLNWLSPSKIRSTIIGGEKKMLHWDDLDQENKIKIYDKGVDMVDKEGVYEMLYNYRMGDMWAPRIGSDEALRTEMLYFRDCLEKGEKPFNDGEAGLRVVELLETSNQSLKAGGRTIEL
ncbi:MAG: Gfo/Idh/MocA family oxidoreductase [Candidatus Glassbacteria bacterium]